MDLDLRGKTDIRDEIRSAKLKSEIERVIKYLYKQGLFKSQNIIKF